MGPVLRLCCQIFYRCGDTVSAVDRCPTSRSVDMMMQCLNRIKLGFDELERYVWIARKRCGTLGYGTLQWIQWRHCINVKTCMNTVSKLDFKINSMPKWKKSLGFKVLRSHPLCFWTLTLNKESRLKERKNSSKFSLNWKKQKLKLENEQFSYWLQRIR